ncbi:MAG TPA: DUF3775 domain-containing protein [Sphingomonas sp.]|nr:DUF3775 domain-containing protein [Sphingomonas sp.]
MDLATPLDLICRIIVRARQLEAQIPEVDDDSEAGDSEEEFDTLGDEVDETVMDELRTAIEDLADDQQSELLALAMVGRGTYDPSEWEEALDDANDPASESPVDQLLDMPTLAEYLDTGLAAFELSCDGVGQID